MTHRLRRLPNQPLSTLRCWFASSQVVNQWWRDQTLVHPLQFAPEAMAISPACARAVGELKVVFDYRELTRCLATPNAWLDCATPVPGRQRRSCDAVSARADRFASCG